MWSESVPMLSTKSGTTRRFPLFLLVFSLFVVVSPIYLWAFDLLTVRTYFVVCFIGLLVSSEVFIPANPRAIWWDRLQWLKIVGWLGLLYVLLERVSAVVS